MASIILLVTIWLNWLDLCGGAVTSLGGHMTSRSRRAAGDPGCFTFEVDLFDGSGEYVRDDSLLDCSLGAKPRYRHRTKEHFVYSFYDPLLRYHRWQQAPAIICIPLLMNYFCVSEERDVTKLSAACWREGFFALPWSVKIRTCDVPTCVRFAALPDTGANGDYLVYKDSVTPDCAQGVRPRYKHRTKNHYLYWYYDAIFGASRWQQGISLVCLPLSTYHCVSDIWTPTLTEKTCWKDLLGFPATVNVTFCPDPCSRDQDPCYNGQCFVTDTYTAGCTCDPGWTGDTCSEDVLECASNPCQHNGSCVDRQASFSCVCTFGWAGERCELVEWWNPILWFDQLFRAFGWIQDDHGPGQPTQTSSPTTVQTSSPATVQPTRPPRTTVRQTTPTTTTREPRTRPPRGRG